MLPLATAIAVDTASPPPVPIKGTDALKTLKTGETLPVPKGAVRLRSPGMRVQGYVNRVQFAPKGSTLIAASGSEIRA